MPQSELFHDFFLFKFVFFCVYKWEWEWNIMTDWLTTQQLKYRRHCPHLNGRYQAEFWLLFLLICFALLHILFFRSILFCLGLFMWFFVGYIEGTESRQYSCTTETVVLISSLSRSISGSNWVRGCVLCEGLFWDFFSDEKPVAFYLLFGACQQYKCVCLWIKLRKNWFLTPLVA